MHAAVQTELDMQRVVEWVTSRTPRRRRRSSPSSAPTPPGFSYRNRDLDARSRSSIYGPCRGVPPAVRFSNLAAGPHARDVSQRQGQHSTSSRPVGSNGSSGLSSSRSSQPKNSPEPTNSPALRTAAASTCTCNSAAARREPGRGLLLIDCDRFKNINDDHGHLVGDRGCRASPTSCARPPARTTSPVAWAATSSA